MFVDHSLGGAGAARGEDDGGGIGRVCIGPDPSLARIGEDLFSASAQLVMGRSTQPAGPPLRAADGDVVTRLGESPAIQHAQCLHERQAEKTRGIDLVEAAEHPAGAHAWVNQHEGAPGAKDRIGQGDELDPWLDRQHQTIAGGDPQVDQSGCQTVALVIEFGKRQLAVLHPSLTVASHRSHHAALCGKPAGGFPQRLRDVVGGVIHAGHAVPGRARGRCPVRPNPPASRWRPGTAPSRREWARFPAP